MSKPPTYWEFVESVQRLANEIAYVAAGMSDKMAARFIAQDAADFASSIEKVDAVFADQVRRQLEISAAQARLRLLHRTPLVLINS